MSPQPTQSRAVVEELAARYRTASKKSKGAILDELCSATGWSRDHARRALRTVGSRPARGHQQGHGTRTPTYDDDVLRLLRKIWAILDAPCGKRLAPFMTEIVSALERVGELSLTPAQRSKLLMISAATIDRRLAQERRRLALARGKIRQVTPLKYRLPIRSSSDWRETHPGVLECTLVTHDGRDGRRGRCHTLALTDVATGWTDLRPLRNPSQRWMFEALRAVEGSLPFELVRLVSNNGAEFVNDQLLRYCTERRIAFTRAVPPRKNGSLFDEHRSSSAIGRSVAWSHDSEEELAVLSDLYVHLRLYVNFFGPRMKLLEKTRRGDKVHRRYDTARTPYQRLLSFDIPEETKDSLADQYLGLNPAELKRNIIRCQDKLSRPTQFDPTDGL